MTPDRFRLLLDDLGLNQQSPDQRLGRRRGTRSATEFLGVDERRLRRWASGKLPIPHTVELLLEIMVAYGIRPSDLDDWKFEE
jgi:hypothetical protein